MFSSLACYSLLPQVAKVGGEYMGILETSCGTSVIAVGSTVYELSGVSLTSRTLEVLTMSASECSEVVDAPSTASCYRYVRTAKMKMSEDSTFTSLTYSNVPLPLP